MPKPGGTIYAIGALGTPWVKIGCTTKPIEKRLATLQTGHPFPLTILAAVAVATDVQRVERQVHAFLTAERQRGEWFDLAMDEVSLAALILRALQAIAEEEPPGVHEGPLGRTIAERVEQCRTEKGWTRSELARRAHLNATHVWKISEGQRPHVQAETVRRLARAFGVTTDYLLGMDLPDDEGEDAA